MTFRQWLRAFVLVSAWVSPPAQCQTSIGNIQLPQAPQFPQGQDSIRGADGTTCTTSTAPRDKYMDIGVVAGGGQGTGVENSYPYILPGSTLIPGNQYNRATVGVYGRIVINLDKVTTRIDCNRLYELEIIRLKSEIEQMKLYGVGKEVAK